MWLDETAVDGQQQQKSRATNSNSSLTEVTVTEMDVNGNGGDVDRDEMFGQMDGYSDWQVQKFAIEC